MELTARTKKNETNLKIANEIKENWTPPEVPIVHWDEKETPQDGKKVKRMTVAVSGDGRVPKHLGSFRLEDGTGESGAKAVVGALDDWGMTIGDPEKVPGMQVVDTCSVNTGKVDSKSK
jgi:hypothetical protein